MRTQGISISHNDTILFIEHDLQQAKNLKIISCAFEKLSRLKINFHRSELCCYGEAKDYVEQYSLIFVVGGIGVRNLEVQNVCLLSKWLFKLINEEGISQTILKKKYLREDSWFGHLPLKIQYLLLYNIARNKNDTTSAVFRSTPLKIYFRRALVGDKLQKWEQLVTKMALVHLDDQPNFLKWN
ncbi:hypothetical protein U9M48_002961, partial [Paspalum notatum var. saurae]